MFIRINSQIINMDQIIRATYREPSPKFNSSDEATGEFWPCAVYIYLTHHEYQLEFTGDQAIEVWEKLLQYGDFGGGE